MFYLKPTKKKNLPKKQKNKKKEVFYPLAMGKQPLKCHKILRKYAMTMKQKKLKLSEISSKKKPLFFIWET